MDEHRYDDIIALLHHQSPTRRRMPPAERAAQFSPFAALTGYDACIRETARVTGRRTELAEDEQNAIGEKLYALQLALEKLPRGQIPGIAVTYFEPDARKAGGDYQTVTDGVKKVDPVEGTLYLAGGGRIPLEEITALDGAFFAAFAED